jgi:hypothetical protein
MLASLAASAEEAGWVADWPSGTRDPEGFAMRNDLPLQHGAQPGHSADPLLSQRFLRAFEPKLVLGRDGEWISVFREGCAYYRVISATPTYRQRPDLLAVAGRPTPGFPKLVTDDGEALFSFDLSDGSVLRGSVAVINAPTPRLLVPPESSEVSSPSCIGLIECSTNKTAVQLERQIEQYRRIYSAPDVPAIAVCGNEVKTPAAETVHVPLCASIPDTVAAIAAAGTIAVTSFGLD